MIKYSLFHLFSRTNFKINMKALDFDLKGTKLMFILMVQHKTLYNIMPSMDLYDKPAWEKYNVQ